MEYNVFGSPITNSTLQSMAAYSGKTITREDRVREALASKNNEYPNARNFVENLIQKKHSCPFRMRCLLYNASGDPINLSGAQNCSGAIVGYPLPLHIENGQWGAFLNLLSSEGDANKDDYDEDGYCEIGSIGGVVYRSVLGALWQYQWCVAWSMTSSTKVYCEVGELVKCDIEQWRRVLVSLGKCGQHHSCNTKEMYSVVSASDDSTDSILEALITAVPVLS